MNWIETSSYLNGYINTLDFVYYPLKVAAFDLDDTLLVKNTGNIMDVCIPNRIEHLVKNNFIIIVVTNQSRMSNNTNFDINKWKEK